MTENRIKEWRQKRGFSQQTLADSVGTSKSQIDKLEKNARRLTVDWMVRLAKALSCDPRELLPTEILLPDPVFESPTAGGTTLPVKRAPTGEAIDLTPCPPSLLHTKGAYGLYVTTQEMVPMYRMGQLLYIAPYKPPKEGAGIVILFKDGSYSVREYLGRTKEGIKTKSYLPSKEEDFSNREIAALHSVTGATEPQ